MSTVTDPIADFLARVRNGARARRPEVLIPYSRIKAELARILKDEGYISDYSIDTSGERPRIKVVNKLVDRSSAIAGLRRGSRPRLRRFVWGGENPRGPVRNGPGIPSPSAGVLSGPRGEKEKIHRR